MNKTRFISIITLGLVVLNVILIAFILLNKPVPPPHLGPRNIIIERLGFDEKQIRQYDDLINQHRTAIRGKEGQMLELKNQLYATLIQKPRPGVNDSLLAKMGSLQQEIELVHYRHFQDIQGICQPQQQAAFRELVKEIGTLFYKRMPAHKPL